MNIRITSSLLAALLAFAVVADSSAQTAAFTYQGRLNQNGAAATGLFDVRFTMHDQATGGSPLFDSITNSAVGVTNGLFTVLLDFFGIPFTGGERWLDIAVRPSSGGAFTRLDPRQPITPTPYAVTALSALSVADLDGYSLNASDGSITDALFVDGGGEVGIGTTQPAARLHVVSAPEDAVPPRLESKGGSRYSAGWDFYHNGVGKGYVGVPDANAGIAPGELALFGGPGVRASLWGGQVRALTTDTAGNVQVSGEVKLGEDGRLRAASGDESLRIVRGMVDADGTILRGSGFHVSRVGDGDYRIIFVHVFSAPPVLTVTPERSGNMPFFIQADAVTTGSANVFSQVVAANFTFPRVDTAFHFTAIGPR